MLQYKKDKTKTTTSNNQQPTQQEQQNTSPTTTYTPNTDNDFELTPNDEAQSSTQTADVQPVKTNNELNYLFSLVHKKTKDVDLLGNMVLRTRLQNILGSRFDDLQAIYDNSENSEIWIPYRKHPDEIEVKLLDTNDPNGTNATIVVNPKTNVINVGLTMNKKNDWFLENGNKTAFYVEIIEYYESLKAKYGEQ